MSFPVGRTAHGAWFAWQPALEGMRRSDCEAFYIDTFIMLFLDFEWVSTVAATEVHVSLPSNVRSTVPAAAGGAVIVDVTSGDVERTAHGVVTVAGETCVLHTMGVFVQGRTYRARAQIACKLLG